MRKLRILIFKHIGLSQRRRVSPFKFSNCKQLQLVFIFLYKNPTYLLSKTTLGKGSSLLLVRNDDEYYASFFFGDSVERVK